MSETTHTMMDWGLVNKKIEAFNTSLDLKNKPSAFVYYCLDRILRLDHQDIRDCITDGGDDRGIDAVYIENTDDKKVIHLFQFKHRGEFEKSKKNFPSSELEKIHSFLVDLLNKDKNLKDSCNPSLYQKVLDIWGAYENDHYRIVVHLASNGMALVPIKLENFKSSIAKYEHISVKEYDLKNLSDFETARLNQSRTLKLKLYDEQNFSRTDGFVKGLIGTVNAREYIKFITTSPRQEIDESLFDENIRLFLGERNEVNAKILKSALSENPLEFWYLNNGITIVCDSFIYQPHLPDPVVTINNPQIVNGGQTSYSLFEASNQSFDKLNKLKVLVKIIETEDKDFRNKIAEATNSQTPIRSRDLRSNDTIQLKLESSLYEDGYYYERKRNQHLDKPSSQRIDALRCGQLIMAYYKKEPDKAKTQSDRIFGEYYDLIFDPHNLSSTQIISMYQLYEVLDMRKKLAQEKIKKEDNDPYMEHWLTEGIYHALYTVALLCERDGIALDDFKKAKTKVNDAISIVSDYVAKQKRASAYRIFRSVKAKENIKNHLFNSSQQMELPLQEKKTLYS